MYNLPIINKKCIVQKNHNAKKGAIHFKTSPLQGRKVVMILISSLEGILTLRYTCNN